MTRRTGLDPRTWLVWGAAASLPPLLGRNPPVLIATLLAVLGVRAAWTRRMRGASRWSGIVRLALVFAGVGVVFNVLTVRTGDREIARIPDAVPILGGPLTLNALVYGLLSGLALLILVLIGTTVGGLLDWATALRLMPERLTTVAVAGSVAFAFVPQTAAAFGEIREAQAARGHRSRGARDLAPLLVPLLTVGLERAITLAEALEARAFGASPRTDGPRERGRGVATALGLAAAASGGYLLAIGRLGAALGVLAVAVGVFAVALRGRLTVGPRRTRFRTPRWTAADTIVTVGAGGAALATLLILGNDPASLRYEPYPSLAIPHVSLPLLTVQGLLFVPVFVVAGGVDDAEEDDEQ